MPHRTDIPVSDATAGDISPRRLSLECQNGRSQGYHGWRDVHCSENII